MKYSQLNLSVSFCLSIFALLLFFNSSVIYAQTDTVVYEIGFPFEEGIYSSFNEFKSNSPSILERIESRNDQLLIWDDSTQAMIVVDPNKVWGYALADNVYISFENAFWRLINIGQLSQFSAIIVRTIQTVDAFGFPMQSTSRSIAQLFLDMNDGRVYELTAKNLMPFVENSAEITAKYKNIKRIKARGLVLVLKSYNQLYPLQFPVYE